MKSASLLPILLVVLVDVLGFTVVIPLLPFYAEHFGASPLTIGLLVGSYAFFGLLAAPLLGHWSDHHGRKPVLLISQLGTLASFVMLAQAPSLTWVFVARALDGATSANLVAARAYIADVTPPKERAAAFGLIALMFAIGHFIGPASAGWLARYGITAPIWAAAALSACSVLLTLWLLPSTPPPAQPPARGSGAGAWQLLQTHGAGRVLWQWFGFLLAFSIFTSGFALYCERRLQWHGAPYGVTQVGYLLGYVGLLGLIAQLALLRPMLRRLGESGLVRWGLLATALAYAGLSVTHGLPLLLLCLTIGGLATNHLRPALLALISQQVPPERQGQVFGLSQTLQFVAMMIGPLMGNSLIQHGLLDAWALLASLPLVLALALAWHDRHRHRSTAVASAD